MKKNIVQPIADTDWPRVLSLRVKGHADGGRTLSQAERDFLTRAVATNRRKWRRLDRPAIGLPAGSR